MTPPTNSVTAQKSEPAAQPLAALAVANELRVANATFKRLIAAGLVDPIEAVMHCTMPLTVGQFLRAFPGIAYDKSHRISRASGVSLDRRFDRRPTLTERERVMLATAMMTHSTIKRLVQP